MKLPRTAARNILLWLSSDWLLVALLTAVAFLLGCYEMADSDIWWHLSGGRWILEHHRVPDLDPFTFGSQDRPWIDIHWGFQVLMSGAYAAGGVAGLILVAAAAGSLALLVAATARRRNWPIAVTVACWSPALVLMSWRFDPRPEVFTLLYIACFLAVLWRAPEHPRLLWILPVLQVVWVNTQGLFIFGPILLGFFLVEQAARHVQRAWRRGAPASSSQNASWVQLGTPSLAVAAACLLNPYLLDGARFPFDLLPKVTESGNIYKEYIDQLASPRKLLQESGAALDGNWYLRSLYLLLILLPVSFVFPAAWRASRGALQNARRKRTTRISGEPSIGSGAWVSALGCTIGLLIASTLCFSRPEASAWRDTIGDGIPFAIAAAWLAFAMLLARRSWGAAALTLVGGAALAVWAAWLRAELLSPAGAGAFTVPLIGLGGALLALLIYSGTGLFRILLAIAFGYLSLQALQNASRFALVAGLLLTWNLGEWTRDLLLERRGARLRSLDGPWLRLAFGLLLVSWIGAW